MESASSKRAFYWQIKHRHYGT